MKLELIKPTGSVVFVLHHPSLIAQEHLATSSSSFCLLQFMEKMHAFANLSPLPVLSPKLIKKEAQSCRLYGVHTYIEHITSSWDMWMHPLWSGNAPRQVRHCQALPWNHTGVILSDMEWGGATLDAIPPPTLGLTKPQTLALLTFQKWFSSSSSTL